jgi:hypothetical protein
MEATAGVKSVLPASELYTCNTIKLRETPKALTTHFYFERNKRNPGNDRLQ